MTESQDNASPSLAVVGGGLAGMAAALAAVENGLRVELFEQKKYLGGRAGSFDDTRNGQVVDLCQHVSMGCCTNLADFRRRTGTTDCFDRHERLHFISPDGDHFDFAAGRCFPTPLHLLPALMGLKFLTFAQRLGIARTMIRLAREGADRQGTIGEWLRDHGQSERVIELFWSAVLVSALSETVDRISLPAARKVFVDGMLASRRAHELEIPNRPLREIFDGRAASFLSQQGAIIHRGAAVKRIEGDSRRVECLLMADGTRRRFDFITAAVPWRRLPRMLTPDVLRAVSSLENVEQIEPAAITAVHLWFDRPISALPHAVLTGKLGQWVFFAEGYCQVVISASGGLRDRPREQLLAAIRDELESVWPEAAAAQLVHWRTCMQPAAVFSPRPGIEMLRPPQQTPLENLTLAGDWTATGWPATMESAVRSGYLAVEAILRCLGKGQQLLAADLPRGPLARLVCGG